MGRENTEYYIVEYFSEPEKIWTSYSDEMASLDLAKDWLDEHVTGGVEFRVARYDITDVWDPGPSLPFTYSHRPICPEPTGNEPDRSLIAALEEAAAILREHIPYTALDCLVAASTALAQARGEEPKP